jgi:hypothetical protein
MRSIAFALVLLALPACGNTYHPEWHPVTVSHFSQNLDYPVTVQNGGDPAMRSPVIIAPAPMPAPAPPPALR